MFKDHAMVFNRPQEKEKDENIHAKREYTGPEHYVTDEERAVFNHPVKKMLEGPKKVPTLEENNKLWREGLKKMAKAGVAAGIAGNKMSAGYIRRAAEVERIITDYNLSEEQVNTAREIALTTEIDYVSALCYIATKKQSKYTCENCNATVAKENLADHASECRGEIDYSALKPGMRVKIKSDSLLLTEWSIDRFSGKIVVIKEIDMPSGDVQTISCGEYGVSIPFQCIESIITEEPDPRNWEEKQERDALIEQKDVGPPGLWLTTTQPKQVKALWLGQTEGDVEVESFADMLKWACVGFYPTTQNRAIKENYILQTRGSNSGVAIRGNAQWANRKEQPSQIGTYYIFPTAPDLYKWMAAGE